LKEFSDERRFKLGHPLLLEMANFVNLDEYFKFTFVRNPFDRLVSSFFYISRYSTWKLDVAMRKQFKLGDVDFSFFVKNILLLILKNPDRRPRHFKSQFDFFFSNNGESLIDFVGRCEDFQEDFNIICDKIKIPRKQLPYKNASKHKHYTEYYDDETRQIVAEKYAKDIEYFGYEFGE
jgi:hypothetical protein